MNQMTTEVNAASGVAEEINTPVESQSEEITTHDPVENQQEAAPAPTPEQRLEKERQTFQRRIDRKTAQTAQARAEAAELRQQLERTLSQQKPADQDEQRQIKPEDIDRLANERAEQISLARDTTSRSNSVFSAGMKVYGDAFRDSVKSVIEDAGELIDGRGHFTALGEAIVDSDSPEKLLDYLGQNPDEAESLRGLSPAKLGRRLGVIEAQMAKTSVSKPAVPLKPVNSSGASKPKVESEMTDAEWYAARKPKRA